jgi:DNA-binding response OmpR family regulator
MTGQTILVVDDHVSLANAFSLVLRNAGFEVRVANTAADGLKIAKEQRVDAVILDLRMPFINGAGFLYRLRSIPDHAATPVMVVTGATVEGEMAQELAELGAVVRFKPLDVPSLLTEIDHLLPA